MSVFIKVRTVASSAKLPMLQISHGNQSRAEPHRLSASLLIMLHSFLYTKVPHLILLSIPYLSYPFSQITSRFEGRHEVFAFIIKRQKCHKMAPAAISEGHANDRLGPHPSYIEIAKPYIFQSKVQECLSAAVVSEGKDDSIRLQGIAWIDSVRKFMHL